MICSNKNNEIQLRKRHVEDSLFHTELLHELRHPPPFFNLHEVNKTETMFHFYVILSVHYDILKLWEQKRMHNSTTYVFFLFLNTYMFLPCHLQRAYTN
jgi:hypothetical protein